MAAARDELMPLQKQHSIHHSGNNQFSNFNLNQNHKYQNVALVQSNSNSISNNKGLAFDKAEENVKIQRGKNVSSNAIPKNSSTLSLHIAAYENFIEAGDTVSMDLKKDLVKEQKQISVDLALNSFEFPRQQTDGETADPAVMKFTASQQLLIPNQLDPKNNALSSSAYTYYHLPLDIETRKIYREWIPAMLCSNTFLVVPDLFIQARTAALVSFNILQLYPSSSVIIVNADKEKDKFCAHLKAVGIPLEIIHQIKDDKQFKKQCADGTAAGVYFTTTKTMINMLGKNSLDNFDFKLMVVCGAEKADSTSGLAKVVSGSFMAGKLFRVLALSFALPKKLAKAQSLTSNLQISTVMITKTSEKEMGEILFSKDTNFIDCNYDSRELELMKAIISLCLANLASVGVTNIQSLKSIFFLDTEAWSNEIPKNPEYDDLVSFTAILIEGYQILIQYGLRALFLYFASKGDDIFEHVEEIDEVKELKQKLETVNFKAFPPRDKRNELKCHPKLEQLFNIVNTDKNNQKFVIFCSSPFGARAITEYLVSSRVKCIENVSGMYDLLKDKPHLRGPEPFNANEVKKVFMQPGTPVMVSTNYIDNFGLVLFEFSISMDYFTSGIRYTRFGRTSYSLLTDGYENIPIHMQNFEKKLTAFDINHGYKFNTAKSKLELDKSLRSDPIQYSVPDLLNQKSNEPNAVAAAPTVGKITVAMVAESDAFLKKIMGDFSMDHFDGAYNATVEFLNEYDPRNPYWINNYVENVNETSTPFERALHSALFDPLNPKHLEFAENLPNVEFAEWDIPTPSPSTENHHHQQRKRPAGLKKTKSIDSTSTKLVTEYYSTFKDPKLSDIQEKMKARRMAERQRWLCILRDAKDDGQIIAVSKDVANEIEKLSSELQFWNLQSDC